jgi:hypothetical protein
VKSETECFEHFEREDSKGAGWKKCADEGETCQCKGKVIMHGEAVYSHGHVAKDYVDSSIECSVAAFGSDPARHVRKECYCKDKVEYQCTGSCTGEWSWITITNYDGCTDCNADGTCTNPGILVGDAIFTAFGGDADIIKRGTTNCQERFRDHCDDPNSEYKENGSRCEQRCDGQEDPSCTDTDFTAQDGIPGCFCKPGFVRNLVTSACVREVDCPPVDLRELQISSEKKSEIYAMLEKHSHDYYNILEQLELDSMLHDGSISEDEAAIVV